MWLCLKREPWPGVWSLNVGRGDPYLSAGLAGEVEQVDRG